MYGNQLLSVIMPVYNEERTLKEIAERVLAQKSVDRLIIIDDHSRDASPEIIRRLAKGDRRITALRNERNMGKGYSVRRGLEEASNGIILIQDADLEYYPEDYRKLLPELDEKTIVLGTRMRGKHTGHEYGLAKLANATLTGAFNILYGTGLTDMNTCYKLFTKDMLKGIELRENGFLIEPEILIALVRKGYRIKEVNIRYKGRTYEEGKKITARDGINQALFMLSKRFGD